MAWWKCCCYWTDRAFLLAHCHPWSKRFCKVFETVPMLAKTVNQKIQWEESRSHGWWCLCHATNTLGLGRRGTPAISSPSHHHNCLLHVSISQLHRRKWGKECKNYTEKQMGFFIGFLAKCLAVGSYSSDSDINVLLRRISIQLSFGMAFAELGAECKPVKRIFFPDVISSP